MLQKRNTEFQCNGMEMIGMELKETRQVIQMELNGIDWKGREWDREKMGWDGSEWNEMKHDGIQWDGMEWDIMRQHVMGWNFIRWHRIEQKRI